MPRSRAENYGLKKAQIIDMAATIFAERGYVSAKMEDIAERCGVSKSMLYHYFKRKEDILFEILTQHVSSLNSALEVYLATHECTDPLEYFKGFMDDYLSRTTGARERHAVTLSDTRWLTEQQLVIQERLERRNVELIMQLLHKIMPDYEQKDYTVYSFLLVGMINWIELWYKATGPMRRSELHDRLSQLFLNGFLTPYAKGDH